MVEKKKKKEVYRYYSDNRIGKQLKDVEIEKSSIRELVDDTVEPYIKIHSYVFKNSWVNYFAINTSRGDTFYTFYIPGGLDGVVDWTR